MCCPTSTRCARSTASRPCGSRSASLPPRDNTRDNTGDDGSDQPAKQAPRAAKRAGGTLRGAILDILEANPDRQYKVGELCKVIDAANAGTGAAKASQGAVANALDTLSRKGTVTRTVDRPATFQLTPPPTD